MGKRSDFERKPRDNPSYKHGHNCRGKRSSEYEIWAGMKKRCDNINDSLYPYYGGRGIKVCQKWHNFETFLKDMGPAPEGFSLDRIDNNQGYSFENCRWATKSEQSRNKRNNIWLTRGEESLILKDWCSNLELSYKNVHRQLHQYGWSPEKVLGEGFEYGKKK